MPEVIQFLHTPDFSPNVVATQNDDSFKNVSENELRNGLKHLVNSNIFTTFIYTVHHQNKILSSVSTTYKQTPSKNTL